MDIFESKRIREERASLSQEMNRVAVKLKGSEGTNEDKELLRKLIDQDKQLRDRLETVELLEAIPQEEQLDTRCKQNFSSPQVTERDKDQAFRAWALKAAGHDQFISDEMRNAAHKTGINMNVQNYTVPLNTRAGLLETRTGLLVGTDASGGYTQNDALVQSIEVALKAFGGVASVATTITTSTGAPIRWATVDDTAVVASQIAENTDLTADNPTFGYVELGSYSVRSGIWPVSVELLQDSEVPIVSYLGEALGTRIARKVNTDLTTGAGSTGPKGVVVASTEGVNLDASATGVDYADLLSLYHSVDPAYRANAKWMFNDTEFANLRALVDEQGRPLWQVSLAAGEPDLLMGKGIVINQQMANFGAGNKSHLFGDFSKYIFRRVRDTQIVVLRERYAEQNAVAFMCWARFDGDCICPAAIKHLVV